MPRRFDNALRNIGKSAPVIDVRIDLILICCCALALGIFYRPFLQGDDAAISFRYAARFAEGKGLTYNDYEKVQGFSNPLLTVSLGLFKKAGVLPENGAFALDLLGYAATAVLVFLLSRKLGGGVFAWLSVIAMLVGQSFREGALSGLEPIIGAALGLAAIFFLGDRRDFTAGIFLGLAFFNKLDAGLLALGVVIAVLLFRREFPWRLMLAAVLVYMPWLSFASLYYGNPLPQSMLAKLFILAPRRPFNHFWIWNAIRGNIGLLLPLLLSCLSFLFFRRRPQNERLLLVCLVLWFLLHALAYSIVSFGDYYPWYMLMLVPPVMILGPSSLGNIFNCIGRKYLPEKTIQRVPAIAVVVLGLLLCFRFLSTPVLHPAEAFDDDRRMAGIYLAGRADKNEVVQTAFGWPAYEALENPVYDDALLNSKQRPARPMYILLHGVPVDNGSAPPVAPSDTSYVPVATFNRASKLFPGYSWFVLYASRDSKIYREYRSDG